MKKITLISTLIGLTLMGFSQKTNEVTTTGGTNDVYFNMGNGLVKAGDNANWDIAFNLLGFEASILTNDGHGVLLYKISDDIGDWATADTTGKMIDPIRNSTESWSFGAFANLGVHHPDYGWGLYNSSNHDINGSRLFVIQTRSGEYKKIKIDKMTAAGVFSFEFADIDGNNAVSKTFDKKDAKGNFYYYDMENDKFVANEPASNTSWHLLFTKYAAPIQAGPSVQYYPVSGVKINLGLQVAERTGVDPSSDDTSSLVWNENITEIGYDWKTFNSTTMRYDIDQTKTYFIKDKPGNVWKIYFTDYQGGAAGTYFFTSKVVKGVTSVNEIKIVSQAVYPNPASDIIKIKNFDNETVEIFDFTGQKVKTSTEASIDVSDLSNGMYHLMMIGDNVTRIQKLLISK